MAGDDDDDDAPMSPSPEPLCASNRRPSGPLPMAQVGLCEAQEKCHSFLAECRCSS